MNKNAFSYEELLACANNQLFDEDSPTLPNGKLLMFSRVVRISEEEGLYQKGLVQAAFDIHKDLWFFKYHFTRDPVMPGCLGLDALWQLLGFFLAWQGCKGKGRALGADKVQFSGEVLPTSTEVRYDVHVKRVRLGKIGMIVGDGFMTVDGVTCCEAKGLKVGLLERR